MRKNDRDGIVELISSIKEAIDYCRNADFNTASTLIADCEAAISSILGILKSQLTDDSVNSSYNTILSNLESAVQIFHNTKIFSIQDEIYDSTKRSLSILNKKLLKEKVQYEVVFLPYNATMWDSLESIWRAAKEDPRCIPYVIPIPYYDKNMDGTLGQMHYDGDLFPDYVPITHFSKYDIETRKPEIIYIHNPYDKFNKVTSVHPAYYSYHLKKYTDMLVYVPYFIVMDYLSEDFAILPGVRFADKVIVQSEHIAEEYKKFYPGEDKDKFLPLGSPKLDKVFRMNQLNRGELNLPEKWKELIGNKKVILYNTHLDNIMNHGELLLKKLRYVFSCFENREDVVLLWRPHPFSESTAVAMNPDILESYKNIVAEYKEKRIGIYDDTPDLHRSLALADAYYGDWSSLVPMFGAVGKPVMIQDVNLNREEDKSGIKYLSFNAAYVEKDDIWFSANEFNGLFHMDLKTKKVVNHGCFIDENMSQINLYHNVVKYHNKLIFIPFYANDIAEYDLSTGAITKVPIDHISYPYKYRTSILHDNWLYLLPLGNAPLLKYNLNTNEVISLNKWQEEIEKHILNYANGYSIFSCSYFINNKIYAPLGLENVLFEFDLKDESIKTYQVGQHSGYIDMQFDGENFWLLPREKAPIVIVQWNINTKEQKYFNYDEYFSEYLIDKIPFSSSIITNGKLWIFSRESLRIVKQNMYNKGCEIIDLDIGKIGNYPLTQYFPRVIQKNNIEIMAYPGVTNQIIIINTDTNDIKTIPVEIDKALEEEKLGRYLNKNNFGGSKSGPHILYEDIKYPINHYILNIINQYDELRSEQSRESNNTVASTGLLVHERIRDCL